MEGSPAESTQGPSDFPLPRILEALSPYVKSRQEVIQIRRTLSYHLYASISAGSENEGVVSSLPIPGSSTILPRIPEDVHGVRREYLNALKANIKARKTYISMSQTVKVSEQTRPMDLNHSRVNADECEVDSLKAYLLLLRQRRRYERLRILQDYLTTLSRKPIADSAYLSLQDIGQELSDPPPPPSHVFANVGYTTTSEGRGLMLQLQQSVLIAKRRLAKEQGLLATARMRVPSDGKLNCGHPSEALASSTLRALGATRKAMIEWIEEELGKAGSSAEEMGEATGTDSSHFERLVNQRHITEIKDQYARYIQVRKSLVEMLDRMHSTISSPRNQANVEETLSKATRTAIGKQTSERYLHLDTLNRLLLQTLASQKSLLLHKTHISGTIAKEQKLLRQELERLADESHLLPSYPYLAGRPGFSKTTALLAGQRSTKSKTPKLDEATELREGSSLGKAWAWAFAADAARRNCNDSGTEKLSETTKLTSHAESILSQIDTLTTGLVEPDEQESRNDLWVTDEVVSELRGSRASRQKQDRHAEAGVSQDGGPWRMLDGNLGVIKAG